MRRFVAVVEIKNRSACFSLEVLKGIEKVVRIICTFFVSKTSM